MKSAFITGANQGLGLGFVRHLLSEGWKVFGGTRKISSSLPSKENLVWIPFNVTDDVSIEKAVAKIRENTSRIDLLINNAGINKDTATNNEKEKATNLKKLDRLVLRNLFEVNAVSPMMILQKFLPLLSEDPSFVVNVSSCRASFHDEEEESSGNYGYRASKVALNMLTLASVHDLPKNIRTFAVHPGSVRTAMNLRGESEPKVQAEKIISLLSRWDEKWNGKFLNFDGAPYPL
ncbi:MAG: SDR family NAD(P)-dependent oxidoreductase [Patescibacteria group bacterium]